MQYFRRILNNPYTEMSVTRSSTPLRCQCLRYLLVVRALIIVCQVVGLIIAYEVLGYVFPAIPIFLVIAALSAFSLYSWLASRTVTGVSDGTLLSQLVVDVVALTLLFYFSGGSANPLVSLFLLPVTIAAATLKPQYGGLIAGAAVASYTLLMFSKEPVTQGHINHHDIHVHLWGMWLGFVVSAALVAYFVARIGHTLRQHDQDLSEAREEALRSEQLLALGTLAAGTAHELGTPLGTMAVLTAELLDEHAQDKHLARQLAILRGQVDRCKNILSRMAINAGQVQADSGHRVTVDRYLEDMLSEWQGNRPPVQLSQDIDGERPAPIIAADQSVTQAIQNVLNNAADASPDAVHVLARWSSETLDIEVRDRGVGLASGLRDIIGKNPLPAATDKGGLGIGLFLSRSILERLGGHLKLDDREDGGVCARIELPLSSLRTDTATQN